MTPQNEGTSTKSVACWTAAFWSMSSMMVTKPRYMAQRRSAIPK
jgi:hypothetical protein